MSESTRARYEAVLVELHREMRAGRGEEQRAEELRNQLDALWYELPEEAQEIFDDLSEDLYSIEGKRRVAPLAEGETPDAVLEKLPRAFLGQEDRRALELLRKLPSLEAGHVYAMGRCWERQGFSLGAVCFYDFANEREPKAVYEVSALEALAHANRIDEAVARAEGIEARPLASGTLLLEAASIFHRASMNVEGLQQRAMRERVTKLVECAWNDPTALASIRASGLLAAGFAYEHLGDKERALASFERAVSVHRSEAPLLARGLALLHSDRTRAMRDFTEAAELKTKLDWPYLYAALNALQTNSFAAVERFCETGTSLSGRADVRGRLFEWWAIAAAMQGRPPEVVTALFDRAMAVLPFDLIVRRNAKRYRDAIQSARSVPTSEYELEQPIDEAQAWKSLLAA